MNNIFKLIVMSALNVFLFIGCTSSQSKYIVTIDSIGSIQNKTKYVLFSGIKGVSIDDLEFREYARYINKALIKQGFQKTDLQNANVAIFLRYGISSPKKNIESFSIPVWGETGISSSTTYENSTTYTPSYGIVGYKNGIKSYTTFRRYYELNAVDLALLKKNKKSQLWKMMTVSTGSGNDLRVIFPILVVASQRYMGIDTRNKINIALYENDKRVLEIKGVKVNEK